MSKIIANTVAAKLTVAFVAAAMLFMVAAPAKAQTVEELQALIAQLTAQIAALSGGGSTGGTSCPVLTQPLTIGSQGAAVVALQDYLTATGHFTFSGGSTGYFGPITQQAVASWQAANGVAPAAGYWGPISLAAYNATCVPTTPGGDDEGDGGDSEGLSGGEASFDDFDANSGDDTNLEEGQEDAPVMDVEFDVEDGDVRVSRIDVSVDPGSSNDEDDPWDAFDNVSIWVDGDMIADKDTDSKSDWSKDQPASGDYRTRITGIDWVVREGDTGEFTVGVTVAGGVVDSGSTDTWDFFIPDEGIRAMDGAGVNQYVGDTSDTVSVSIEQEGADDELTLRSSSDDPDATTFEVSTSTRSDWTTVFAFDLDTDDSVNDVTVQTGVVGVQIGTATYAQVVNDARLVIDGENYDDVTSSTTAQGAVLTFDIDDQLVIDAGDRPTAELQLRFNSGAGNYAEGETVTATTTSTGWEAEGADDITVTGTATGETHSLRTSGVDLAFVSSTETYIENNDASTTDNQGRFTLKFDVTAFQEDAYFEKTTSRSTTTTNQAVNYILEDSSGDEVETVDSVAAAVSSTADTDSGYFVVREGETETFTLTVTVDPLTEGYYNLQLDSVHFNSSAAAPDTNQDALPAADFESEQLYI